MSNKGKGWWIGVAAVVALAALIFVDAGHTVAGGDMVSTDTLYAKTDSVRTDSLKKDSLPAAPVHALIAPDVNTRSVQPQQVVDFARTLIGTPYRYASTDPAVGFDCSGFITYVFHHFHIEVPRSSIDFTHAGTEIPIAAAQPGDLILFTGTDSTEKFVGHMGLIEYHAGDSLSFIHSSSGKAMGVTITPLNAYYRGRYVKTVRVF